MLSEKGSIKDTPVMKLLLTIFEQGLTGILYVKREDILKVLYFSRGKIIWAISNSDVDKLENILLNKDLIDPVTIRKVKSESRVSESIGKVLVEKGLITLEELIDSSKEQLKHIIISVLKWKAGGFQFIKDAPPERLLSLDLSVTDFIISYIVEEVDISDIWKEIGTLQLELIKNPDEAKLSKYLLSDKQKELLNSFDGDNRLESILSRHSGGHRESLLRIIYFFMMSELLIKKEFELSDASIFEAQDQLEADQVPEPPSSDAPFEIYNTAEIAKSPTGTSSIFPHDREISGMDAPLNRDISELRQPTAALEGQDDDDSYQMDSSRSRDERVPFADSFKGEDKKRVKLFNVALMLVFLILVFGGVILLLIPWLEDDSPPADIVPRTQSRDIINIEEPPVQEDKVETGDARAAEHAATQEAGKTGGKAANASGNAPGKDDSANIDPKKADAPKTEPKKAEPKKPEPRKEPVRVKPQPGKSARKYFLEGNFITAGDVWKKELIEQNIKYTIMLEMDCKKESVLHAFKLMKRGPDFFILNRRVGNRNCFLVMWGMYRTESSATEAVKSVPNYFWKQQDPPEIVPISKYF